jgi:type I restriction enzyme S subunit
VSHPWQIPQCWAWVQSREIAEIVGGGTPRTDDPTNFDGGEVPWITPADLSGYRDKHISRGARNITKKGLDNSGARVMPEGTVLFSSRAPVGYVAIASNPVSTNQGFKSFVLHPFIKPDYAYYYLQRAKDLAVELSSGTTFREISGAKTELIPFPVAPTAEQERIVGEIEKQFTRLDAAVAALKRVQSNLKRYRAAVLKAVCEGSLVPTEAALARREGRSYEPASVLLERILAERRSRWGATAVAKQQGMGVNRKSQYAEPSAVATDDRTQVPDGWIKATVEQVSSLVQYGSSAKTNEDSDGVAVLRMGNLTGDGRLDVAKLKYLPKNHDEFPGLLLDEGDLLFNRTNSAELVGKSAVYAGNPSPCSFASYLIRVKTVRGCDSRYVALCLNSDLGRTWIKSVVSQQVGQANVNGTKLQAFVFPMPPQSEQSRILAEVERRLSIIDEHEVLVEKDLIRADRLRQAILREAFAGKLVPQDPNDEPASALLERIHAERKAEPKASPNRGRWKKEAQHVS